MTGSIPTHVPFWRTGPARCVLVIVVAVVLGALSGCYEDNKRKEFTLAGCDFFSRESLPEKRYCGKACMRNMQRETWRCGPRNDSQFVSFDY